MERRLINRFWEFDQGGAWIVKKPYDVPSEDVGWFLDFTKSPGTINGRSSTRWESPIVRGADRKRAR